jgi:hypothetical protein
VCAASKMTTIKSKSENKDDSILCFGKENNFSAWKEKQTDICGALYGKQANVLKNYKPHVIRAVIATDYTPAEAETDSDDEQAEFTAAAILQFRIDAEKRRMKAVSSMEDNAPKMYATLWGSMSVDSKQQIRQHSKFFQADLDQDPNILVIMARDTHLTAIHGADDALKVMQKESERVAFTKFMQGPNTSIGEFKNTFDKELIKLAGLGIATPVEEELAMMFLLKLDPSRYADMIAVMSNMAITGIAFPDTLHSAYNAAASWKSVKPKMSTGETMHSVFAFSDDVGAKKNEREGDNGGRHGRGRGNSRGGRGGRGSNSRGGGREGKSETSVGGEKPFVEFRSCRVCNKKGHLARDCPDVPSTPTVLVTTDIPEGEDDERDRYEAYVLDEKSFVLFSDSEVLLDSQAGKSIFKNKGLLTDINQRKPYTLGGVDNTAVGLRVNEDGSFRDLGRVGYAIGAAANILSQPQLLNQGHSVEYNSRGDWYRVKGGENEYFFIRKILSNGEKSNHYSCELNSVLVATVDDNMRRYTKREVEEARLAREFMRLLSHSSSAGAIAVINKGVINCPVTAVSVRNADAIFGPSIPALRGKTTKKVSIAPDHPLAPRVTQVQQLMVVDIMIIKRVNFLLAGLYPLGLILVTHIKDRTVSVVGKCLKRFVGIAKSRNFDVMRIQPDGEGAIVAMIPELNDIGVVVEVAGPGQHSSSAERLIRTVKERVRAHETSMPYVLTKLLLIFLVLFCVSRINLCPNSQSLDGVSPTEQFTGRKLDMKRDLRVGFGDYVQATVAMTDNTMKSRTQGCIALLPVGNITGSVQMWCLGTNAVVTRDQFTVLPLPDLVANYITSMAEDEGYKRGIDPDIGHLQQDVRLDSAGILPDMMAMDDSGDGVQLADDVQIPPAAGVNDEIIVEAAVGDVVGDVEVEVADDGGAGDVGFDEVDGGEAPVVEEVPGPPIKKFLPAQRYGRGVDSLQGLGAGARVLSIADLEKEDMDKQEIRKQLVNRSQWHDKDFALTMSVRAALRERGEEARPVIIAELQQMVDKNVWHGVKVAGLSHSQKRAIIRSSMFLKDKYLASGAFDRFKARLVAGGDQQDKNLYDNLSSPTAATTSVLTVAAIAATEGRMVAVIDIGGAFLNADMEPTGVTVHMRLDRVMSAMLVQIDKSYVPFLEESGTMVVGLDKALYGCVEASALWYNDLRSKLLADGFVENPYDVCVFNKDGKDGNQITAVVHVDDLLVTSVSQPNIDLFGLYLKSVYPETRTASGLIVDYIGMTFDFSVAGEVHVTMDNCVNDVLSGCGVDTTRATPAASSLFDVRETTMATVEESKWFHTNVAKVLYLAKRVRPECLTAVAFLTTRVLKCDIDDLAKLRRLLGYIRLTRDRGIVLRIGDQMSVKAYIDAAYGVHQDSGKSHTGCVIVLGEAGPLFAKSSKQKIVTKSSTEAELVGLSDTASQAIHLRNFVLAQGYEVGPAIIYQDNMSCMALMKRGGPGSERSRHINIRHFWLSERVDASEVIIEHLGTEKMFANVLTKPVQGAQFTKERSGLTNWNV